MDAVIDAYFPVVDALGDEIEAVEETILADGSKNVAQRLHHLRGDLSELRRAIRPLRDALNHLMPDPHELFHERTQLYLRDCYDHTVQLIDLLDTYREMCTDLRDFHLSAVNQRMNEVMKFLTIIATIFIPLSFITGVYGMNFNTSQPGNMPELNLPFGYAIVWAVMLSVALGLIGFIWRKGRLQPTE
ncbi:MAG: magnesium/cobalt transporter CorA [Planctomycetaceae bacterium]|nr:magnesium/cobalt transporter CorA [Planctomycetaceae bacterium]